MMARSQFTFTFPNARPGAPVTFSAAVYSSPVDAVADGPTLALDSQRTVAVWTDAAELTATWVDGAGASIAAEASLARPVVTASGGVPGSAPSAASSALPSDGVIVYFTSATIVDGAGQTQVASSLLTGSDGNDTSVPDGFMLSGEVLTVMPGLYAVKYYAQVTSTAAVTLLWQFYTPDNDLGATGLDTTNVDHPIGFRAYNPIHETVVWAPSGRNTFGTVGTPGLADVSVVGGNADISLIAVYTKLLASPS